MQKLSVLHGEALHKFKIIVTDFNITRNYKQKDPPKMSKNIDLNNRIKSTQ